MLVLEPEATTPARPGGRRRLLMLVVPIVALVIASNVGDALTTTWADRHPLALVMLNARNRVLILTTNQLDAVPYYVVATIRLLLSDPLFFLLGMWYGDAAVRWAERKSPSYGGMLRTFERWFGRASYPLVFIAPNNFVCLFAGAAGMRVSIFVVLNVTGTLVRLYAIRWLGDAFQRPIDAVLHFFARYRLILLLLSIALVALTVWNDSRKGRGDLEAALELESELEGDEE
jgi:membrane protein DedA with SNARE-associated domain